MATGIGTDRRLSGVIRARLRGVRARFTQMCGAWLEVLEREGAARNGSGWRDQEWLHEQERDDDATEPEAMAGYAHRVLLPRGADQGPRGHCWAYSATLLALRASTMP